MALTKEEIVRIITNCPRELWQVRLPEQIRWMVRFSLFAESELVGVRMFGEEGWLKIMEWWLEETTETTSGG